MPTSSATCCNEAQIYTFCCEDQNVPSSLPFSHAFLLQPHVQSKMVASFYNKLAAPDADNRNVVSGTIAQAQAAQQHH